jgi:hypothetical protein
MAAVIFSKSSVDIYNVTSRPVEDDFNLYKHHSNYIQCRITLCIVSVLQETTLPTRLKVYVTCTWDVQNSNLNKDNEYYDYDFTLFVFSPAYR